MHYFDIDNFIKSSITHRKESLLLKDISTFSKELSNEIKGKKVLVIGGAGTIGSSYVRALTQFSPGKLIVIDINENGLTELVRDCRSRAEINLPEDFKTYPVNFSDKVFYKIFKKEGPFDIIANFAAHKHVRSEKDVFSIEAMIENNVIKAKELLDFLLTHPPKHFFCVSTDKAANPVNIMGASKKLMEEVILAYSDQLKITTARFANVAFSNGSLLAGFIERMLKKQPLSCPSDVKRFFVSPEEAGQICLCACILGQSGDIFFPKLTENDLVNFADVVSPFLNLAGFETKICATEQEAKSKVESIDSGKYPVYFFKSETSGEKLYEEFYTDGEELDIQRFHQLGVVKNAIRRNRAELIEIIDGLRSLFNETTVDKQQVVELLNSMLPGFQHIETGLNLDQKM
jgi:FlaA1/EpsC-like NDP-sugar epimerase